MTATSPPAAGRRRLPTAQLPEQLAEVIRSAPRSGVLEELLVIDGVTDLAVYRLLTGRGEDLVDVEPPTPPRPPKPGEQPGFLFAISGGVE